MLETIYNIVLQKNICSNKDDNVVYQTDSSKSTFNELKKYLINKEIKFDNVFTEEKKDDDVDITSTNFVINNFLHILNQKDTILNSDIMKFNISKKNIEKDKNFFLHKSNFLKNSKTVNIKKEEKKYNIFEKDLLSTTPSTTLVKNKNKLSDVNESTDINQKNSFYLKKLNNPFFQNKERFYIKNEDYALFLNHEKKNIFLTKIKNHKNVLHSYKNTNKTNNLIIEKTLLKTLDKKESMKLRLDPFKLNDSKKSIEWKKLISQKILFSISNKHNQVEMHLKPEYLGTIHILINMKNNNKAILNFTSHHHEVRMFLDNHMSFLRNSLKKNGIKLEKFTISSVLKNKELTNYKNLFYRNIVNVHKPKKKLNVYQIDLEEIKYKSIDVYV